MDEMRLAHSIPDDDDITERPEITRMKDRLKQIGNDSILQAMGQA